MKVFMCQRQMDYSGGLAVVAANSAEEAFKTFFEDEDYDWMVDKRNKATREYTDDFTKWRTDYYPIEKWFECKVLTANVDKPCVIMEDGYTE
jgi:two-component SAPR family response regulator